MKRFASMFVALVMALTIVSNAEAATYNYVYFSDVPNNHWAYYYINYAAQNGLVNGFNNGTFVPNGALTEAQCCQIVYNCLDYGNFGNYDNNYYYGNNNYSSYWYDEAVSFVERNSNIRISPNQSATRSFICVLIHSFTKYSNYYDCNSRYGYNNYYYSRFTDIYSLPTITQEAINWCQAYGIVNGFQDGTFRPYDTLTRAQGAKIFTITYQSFWQYNYNSESGYYYNNPASSILKYADNCGITATTEDTSTRNEYRQTVHVYGKNSQTYTYTYRGNQWYDNGNRTVAEATIKNHISSLANSMSQKEMCSIACQVAGNYAKSLGWRITSIGEWPSYNKGSGVYWHRLQIANNKKNFTFLVGGDSLNKEAYWFEEDNGFKSITNYREVQNLISSWR